MSSPIGGENAGMQTTTEPTRRPPLADSDYPAWSQCVLWEGADETTRKAAFVEAALLVCEAGDTVVVQAERGDTLYIVLEGELEVVHHHRDQTQRLGTLGAGAWFGEQALLTEGALRTASVVALTPCRLAVVTRPTFERLVRPTSGAHLDAPATQKLHERIVQSLDTLRELDRGELDGVMRVRFEPGEVVFREEDPSDRAYFVVEGSALAFATESGEALARLAPGQCFGEVGVLRGRPRSATVVADGALVALQVPGPAFQRWSESYAPLRALTSTLLYVYSSIDGQQLSVYRGTLDGRPAISTVVGDPSGDGVISTRTEDEDTFLVARVQGEIEQVVRHGDGERVRELRLGNCVRQPDGRLERATVLAVHASGLAPDVGGLAARVLTAEPVDARALRRFERSGLLPGTTALGDPDRICACLRLSREEVRKVARVTGDDPERVQAHTGMGAVCGSCLPDLAKLLAEPRSRKAARPSASAVDPSDDHGAPVPRRPTIHFDRDALHAIRGDPFYQRLFAASLFASMGERFMIRRLSSVAPRITDPRLRAHLDGFLAQESNHIAIHGPLNEIILHELYPDATALHRLAVGFTDDGLDEPLALAVCAAFEGASDGFFSTFFSAYFASGERFRPDDRSEELGRRSGMADLFIWHGGEELGHRHVAFEVMRHFGVDLRTQRRGAAWLARRILRLGIPAVFELQRLSDPRAPKGQPSAEATRAPAHRGVLNIARSVRQGLRFFTADFHPAHERWEFMDKLEAELRRFPIDEAAATPTELAP